MPGLHDGHGFLFHRKVFLLGVSPLSSAVLCVGDACTSSTIARDTRTLDTYGCDNTVASRRRILQQWGCLAGSAAVLGAGW